MAGGAMNETSALKGGRLHQIAIQNRLPTVTFVQSVNYHKRISFFFIYI
jgi:acetyl-CoA carboxylase carboxyltransferase component